jgi:hypothetical protein
MKKETAGSYTEKEEPPLFSTFDLQLCLSTPTYLLSFKKTTENLSLQRRFEVQATVLAEGERALHRESGNLGSRFLQPLTDQSGNFVFLTLCYDLLSDANRSWP